MPYHTRPDHVDIPGDTRPDQTTSGDTIRYDGRQFGSSPSGKCDAGLEGVKEVGQGLTALGQQKAPGAEKTGTQARQKQKHATTRANKPSGEIKKEHIIFRDGHNKATSIPSVTLDTGFPPSIYKDGEPYSYARSRTTVGPGPWEYPEESSTNV